MTDEGTGKTSSAPGGQPRGIGFGLFLFIAGAVLLAQRMEWLPAEADWLFPVILIAWGAGELYRNLRA